MTPHIRQIEDGSRIFSKEIWGKWCASLSQPGPRNHHIHRYLQHDGTWGKNTQYFVTEAELQAALGKGILPDFNADDDELYWLDVMREDCERGFELDLD